MITRADYMKDSENLHHVYYRQFRPAVDQHVRNLIDDIGIDKKQDYAAIMELLAKHLTETEFAMFEARILDDRTYEDIGIQFNIKTREGVRQHVNKVLVKVSSIVKNRIRNYLKGENTPLFYLHVYI